MYSAFQPAGEDSSIPISERTLGNKSWMRSLKKKGDSVHRKIAEDLAALVTSNNAKGTDSCKQVSNGNVARGAWCVFVM